MKTAIYTRINTQPNYFVSSLAAALAIVALAVVATGAHAADPTQPLIKNVTYGDLNLDSAQGAKVLYARLRNAADEVCAPLASRDASRGHLYQGCFDNALSSAVSQVNKGKLTALHNETTSRSRKS
jgi:UrcA family protein